MTKSTDTDTVLVNGRDTVAWHPGMTVRDLLTEMRFTFPRLIVTIDGRRVPHDGYETAKIPQGAEVRVIHMMAGG
jgi:sulfur carrier protein